MEASAKNATNVEQAFMAMASEIKNRYFLFIILVLLPIFQGRSEHKQVGSLYIFCQYFICLTLFTTWCRMASQPASNNAKPPTVQIRGQPVNQKSGCCSS